MSAARAEQSPAPLLSVLQVADQLSCSKDHVYDLIDAGQLRGIDIGIRASKLRVRPEDVAAYLERRTRPATMRAVS